MIPDKKPIKNISKDELDLFNKFCRLQFGLDFTGNNKSILLKAINSRVRANSSASYADYYQKLTKDKAVQEQQEFVCMLTINETYFYREEVQLQFLVDCIVPELQAQSKREDRIRILSIGCSTGAEPYSIAMALHQKFGSKAAELFTIIGADIDYKALEIAKSAFYGPMAFRTLSKKLKHRYFVEQTIDKSSANTQPQLHTQFLLDSDIKNMVSWQYLNIISDIIDSSTINIDILFFRNVSIYFNKNALLSIHQRFVSMLNPNGYLMVGLTESMSNDLGILTLKNKGDIFYFQNHKPSSLQESQRNIYVKKDLPKATTEINHEIKTKPLISKKSNPEYSLADIKSLIQKKDYEVALSILGRILSDRLSILQKTERSQYLLLRAFILFNRQDFTRAYEDTINVLDLNHFSVDAFLLLGMITKWQNQVDDAINWLKKALYIYADCWPAHYYLAGLYHESGQKGKAKQEYLLVVQQLDNPQENFDQVLSIPLKLPKNDIRLLSQSYLNTAKQN